MRDISFIDFLKNLFGDYHMIEYVNGFEHFGYNVRQYSTGKKGDRTFSFLIYDENNSYVVANDRQCKKEFYYRCNFRKCGKASKNFLSMFGVKDPDKLTNAILRFIKQNIDNVNIKKSVKYFAPTKITLNGDISEITIGEILTNHKTLLNYDYLHMDFMGYEFCVYPITKKKFDIETYRINKLVDEEIENDNLIEK